MKVKQAIKKVVALAAGATIVGATLAGAMASLESYPEPFVQGGQWTDSVIVLGQNAATTDVIGAIEIAASLQAAAVTESEVSVDGTTTVTIDAGVKIEKSGDQFNYDENAKTIQEVYDKEDLPELLADGEFEKEDYTQTLTLKDESLVFNYTYPGKKDRTEFDAGDYLVFPDNKAVYTYTLDMDSDLSYSTLASDVETKTIVIQGDTYTITDVKYSSTSGQYTELTLLAGETTRVLLSGQPLTIGDDTITVLGVDANAGSCIIDVNGQSKIINVGETESLGGLEIGVTDAFASNTKELDSCEINAGAREIKIANGGRVKVNSVEIKGTSATITGNQTAKTFGGFTVTYTMKSNDFEEDMYGPAQYKMPGEEWVDPVFGNFKILFDSVSKNTERLSLERSGDEASFKFNNIDGKEVNVEYYVSSSDCDFGTTTGPMLFAATTTSIDLDDYPDAKLWYVLSNGELHLLEFDSYDDSTGSEKLEFNDLTYGKTWKTSTLTSTSATGASETLTLGSLGSITLGYHATNNVLYFNATGNVAKTELNGEVVPTDSGNGAIMTFTSPNEDSDKQSTTDRAIVLNVSYDSTNTEIDLATPSSTWIEGPVNLVYGDSDIKTYATEKGVVVEFDNKDKSYAYIDYPEADVYANVFIAPTSASTSTTGGDSSLTTETVNAIPVGMAALDVDAANMNKNMIVVGGPCINSVAFDLEAPAGECYEGYESGKARIKLYDSNGKTALLVAGMDAQDTQGACRVLANYATYASSLVGDEVEVVVANLNSINVVAPTE